jgi:hypothetical protein
MSRDCYIRPGKKLNFVWARSYAARGVTRLIRREYRERGLESVAIIFLGIYPLTIVGGYRYIPQEKTNTSTRFVIESRPSANLKASTTPAPRGQAARGRLWEGSIHRLRLT